MSETIRAQLSQVGTLVGICIVLLWFFSEVILIFEGRAVQTVAEDDPCSLEARKHLLSEPEKSFNELLCCGRRVTIQTREESIQFLWSAQTTVGYGNLQLQTVEGFVATTVFIVVMLPIYKALEASLGRLIVSSLNRQRLLTGNTALILSGVIFGLTAVCAILLMKYHEDEPSFWESLWFILITISTIGFGDYALPTGYPWLSLILMPVLSFLIVCFSIIAGYNERKVRWLIGKAMKVSSKVYYGWKVKPMEQKELPSKDILAPPNVLQTGHTLPIDEVSPAILTVNLNCAPSQIEHIISLMKDLLSPIDENVEITDDTLVEEPDRISLATARKQSFMSERGSVYDWRRSTRTLNLEKISEVECENDKTATAGNCPAPLRLQPFTNLSEERPSSDVTSPESLQSFFSCAPEMEQSRPRSRHFSTGDNFTSSRPIPSRDSSKSLYDGSEQTAHEVLSKNFIVEHIVEEEPGQDGEHIAKERL